MVEIECLVCGKNFNIPQCIDTDDYDGEVVCTECKALLHIKLIKGKLQKRKIVKVDKRKIELTAEDYKLAIQLAEAENQKLKES